MVGIQTAIDELNTGKIKFDYIDADCCTTEGEVVILLKELAKLENADVAEVVRCPECIYCKNMKCTELKDNTGHPIDVAIFDYCSQGIRKERSDKSV